MSKSQDNENSARLFCLRGFRSFWAAGHHGAMLDVDIVHDHNPHLLNLRLHSDTLLNHGDDGDLQNLEKLSNVICGHVNEVLKITVIPMIEKGVAVQPQVQQVWVMIMDNVDVEHRTVMPSSPKASESAKAK
jgi:hypothetical protein